MGDKQIAPQICPHCGNAIEYLKPVGLRTLEVARLVAQGCRTSTDVAAKLGVRPTHAAILLRRAERAGIITIISRETAAATGGGRFVFEPAIRLRAYDPLSYRLWRNEQLALKSKKAEKPAQHNDAA